MTFTVVNQIGPDAEAAVRSAHPDVEVVTLAGDPPPGLRADALFAGWGDWAEIVRWADATGAPWVQLPGTGVDSVPSALYAGRVVTCARGASAVPIAEFVLGALLAHAKRFPQTWLHEPPKRWNFARLDVLDGATLGLVGLGGIGLAVAARALPFGMRVVALRRTNAPSPLADVEVVTHLDEVLAVADHLVLAAPATARTRHLLDDVAFARVKPGVHVVNVARGSLVDQDALRRALDDGRVSLATLDTVEPEPLPAGHWLYAHPNVRVSAHVSWYTPEMFRQVIDLFVENLGRRRAGLPLHGVVDPDEGY
ncbi:MAG TPA: NAD(P)-dependent oxidoreductase [Acidimicrobiia bacterium]|nr:NAD(P)-dependent oxidoreductase [Acidimicrobiia bacterium]